MDVTLPDGTVIRDVPEGATKEQIRQKAEASGIGGFDALPDDGFSAGEMASNIGPSALQLGKDLLYPVAHPVDAATGIKRLVVGGVNKLLPGTHPDESTVDAVADYYANRYGGVDEALNTLESDPVGLLSDLSMGLGVAGKVGKMPSITKAATAIDPLNMAINPIVKGAKGLIPEGKPAAMYQEAAKIPVTTKRTPERIQRDIQTALDEGIMPTEKGLGKIQSAVGDINSRIDVAIDAATDSQGRVDAQVLSSNISQLRNDLGSASNVFAANDIAVMEKILSDYGTYLNDSGKRSLSARDLQEFKKKTYKRINFDRATDRPDLPTEETLKSMARSAKEQVEKLVPTEDIRALNAREGRLLSLRESLQKPASRIERRDSIGIGLPIKAGIGSAVGGDVGAYAGLLHGMYDAPKNKARLALMLNSMNQQPGLMTTSRLLTPFRQGLMEGGQLLQYDEEYPSVFNR